MNSAHPFEGGVGALGNFIGMFSILLIPAALTYTFGKWVGNVRQGWAIFAVMLVLMIGGLALTVPQEHSASAAMVDRRRLGLRAEPRGQGAPDRRRRVVACGPSPRPTPRTAASTRCTTRTGHSAALAPMFNMAIGEVIWGGVGSGLYGMIFYAIIAVFIGGLMVGRTPEYLGQEDRRPRGQALGDRRPRPVHPDPRPRRGRRRDPCRHRPGAQPGTARVQRDLLRVPLAGEQQRLGLRRDHGERSVLRDLRWPPDARSCGSCPLLAALALAGSLGRAGTVPETSGTLHTDTTLFVVLLTFVILIIGALTFLPGLAVGPIVEHLSNGRLF